MINQLADKARKKMDDTLGSLKRDLDSISTGRASPNLLDTIRVEVYGQFMPISQLANVSVPEATTLSIQIWVLIQQLMALCSEFQFQNLAKSVVVI
jgi:ribosome recycling factor